MQGRVLICAAFAFFHVGVQQGAAAGTDGSVARRGRLRRPGSSALPDAEDSTFFLELDVEHAAATTNPSSTTEAAWQSATGVEGDAEGDLKAFLTVLMAVACALVFFALSFSFLRRWYPQLYANNTRSKAEGGFETAPFTPSSSFFGWASASFAVVADDVKKTGGVDSRMLLEFNHLAMRLLACVAVPLVVILCPLHYWVGRDKTDRLGMISINNVEHGSWVFWVHVVAVWYVVVVAEHLVFREMHKFLQIRFEWLLALEPPRSTTLIVEGIPEAYRSDEALGGYFNQLFPDCVETAYVVKQTSELVSLLTQMKATKLSLEKAHFKRAMEEVNRLQMEVNDIQERAQLERKRILEDAAMPMVEAEEDGEKVRKLHPRASAVNSSAGFVTFTSERETMLALNMRCSADVEEFVLSIPPEPSDIQYNDLRVPPLRLKLLNIVGYACIFFLFWSYLPFILLISSVANLNALVKSSKLVHDFVKAWPMGGVILEGLLSTLALNIFLSFLPSILMKIFSWFYSLKASTWAQLRLQRWYFWFLVLFIILITAIGNSLVAAIKDLLGSPAEVFIVLTDSMPSTTHFYLNFMVLQCASHALNLTRLPQLAKYWGLRAVLNEERAVELAEPEEQGYHGIGGRSARFTLNLVIGIVFCCIAPGITVVTLFSFVISRIVYGYLIVFAETPKHDLGGVFFVQQLWHVQLGVLIFAFLMSGVLLQRANTIVPAILAAVSLAYLIYCLQRFSDLSWEVLPFAEWCTPEAIEGAEAELARYRALGDERPSYRQPELAEDASKAHGRYLTTRRGGRHHKLVLKQSLVDAAMNLQ